jgi:hypothetical protein
MVGWIIYETVDTLLGWVILCDLTGINRCRSVSSAESTEGTH